jgi:CheY-like chemotaxis protein
MIDNFCNFPPKNTGLAVTNNYHQSGVTYFTLNTTLMESINYTGSTILVAEDNETYYEYVRQVFLNTGLTLLHAINGQEAIDLCRDHPEIRMILMDGLMPVMNGYDATREIRKIRPALPIVLLTAYVSQISIRDAVASGCTDYLAKPIGREELLTVLKKWMVV